MKAISIREAQGQLGQLVAEACNGETIVLMDGDNEVTLAPRGVALEEANPELESELLKAVNGNHYPLEEDDLRKIANRALRDHRARQG
jgi:antitoxin (DNA-binding transcriptional repressor) of toxin-antitoxin stability system